MVTAAVSPPQLDQRSTTSAAVPATCADGSVYCVQSRTEKHDHCTSGTLTLDLPGFEGENTVHALEASIEDHSLSTDLPQINFYGDGHDGCVVTSAQLRDIVARVRAHLDRLDQLAEQYDSLTGGAR